MNFSILKFLLGGLENWQCRLIFSCTFLLQTQEILPFQWYHGDLKRKAFKYLKTIVKICHESNSLWKKIDSSYLECEQIFPSKYKILGYKVWFDKGFAKEKQLISQIWRILLLPKQIRLVTDLKNIENLLPNKNLDTLPNSEGSISTLARFVVNATDAECTPSSFFKLVSMLWTQDAHVIPLI